MIAFAQYYHINADDITVVETASARTPEYPYALSVTLKSGKELVVKYSLKSDRDQERDRLIRQIDQARRRDFEQIYSKLYLLLDGVRRMDKRQLRIWRILKQLLPNAEEVLDEYGQT